MILSIVQKEGVWGLFTENFYTWGCKVKCKKLGGVGASPVRDSEIF